MNPVLLSSLNHTTPDQIARTRFVELGKAKINNKKLTMFSVGFCWEFQMESHALVGTGMPISLATPIRHSNSKARNYTPSSKSFRKCCVQFRHKKAAAPQFRKQQKCSTSVPRRRWRWQPSITESNNLAPQSLEQNKSGSPVPPTAKVWQLSSKK